MTDLAKRYEQLRQQKEQTEQAMKEVEQQIIEQWENLEWDAYNIKVITSRTPKLRDDIDKNDLMEKFPKAVENKLNIKELSKIPEAHQFLKEEEKSYLQARQRKDLDF